MAKTTRPTTDIKPDLEDAVVAAPPVVMAEPDQTGQGVASDAPVMPLAETPDTAPDNDAPPQSEIAPEPEPETAPPPRPVPPAKPASGFSGMVFGGLIAAALGYGVATFAPMSGMSDQMAQTTALEPTLAALSGRIAALEVAPIPAVDPSFATRLEALEKAPAGSADLAAVTASIAALAARLTALEAAPTASAGADASPDLAAAVAALRAEVEGIRGSGPAVSAEIEAMAADAKARLAEAEAQAAQLKAEAEETARKSMARASVSRIQAALDSGAPFASALANLPGLDVPTVLTDAAESGLPSQSALEAAFPDAARAGLEASLRADMGDTWSDRAAAFLQSTTGARSLSPREGTDPDAVLSRAEAAVKARDLPTALTELQGLPPEGQAAMADFIAMAQKRMEAAAAVATLSAAIEG